MGCVQQAVLEFDEEVQAPWRPRLVVGARRRRRRVGPAAAPASVPPQPVAGGRLPSAGAARRGRCRRAGRRSGAPAAVAPGAARPVGARPSVPAPGRRGARLRLTRRARRLAVVLALAAGVALGSWLGPLARAAATATCGSPG